MKERSSNSQGVTLRTKMYIRNPKQPCMFTQAVLHRRSDSVVLESKHISNEPTKFLFAYIRVIFAQGIWMNCSL